jgi:hypothetical protein
MTQEAQKPQLNIPVVSTSLSVGQTVWYKSLSGRKGDDVSLKETKISSVGKKYFETKERYLGRFFKDSLKHDAGQYSSRYQIYLSKEQYENEVEANRIYSELRNIFSSYGRTNMELSKLRAILSIVRS